MEIKALALQNERSETILVDIVSVGQSKWFAESLDYVRFQRPLSSGQ